MSVRQRFERKLNELHNEVLEMGRMVDEELFLALEALKKLDIDLATQVHQVDNAVNQKRFSIEEQCLTLIATQQPAAGDLRTIVAVINMIVDLERMGDQAKGIAKVIPHITEPPTKPLLSQLEQMSQIVHRMLQQCLTAYDTKDIGLAKSVAGQDDDVDELFAQLFKHTIKQMADTKHSDDVEAGYEILRVARELERFGDLATNIAERVVYITTGSVLEINVDTV